MRFDVNLLMMLAAIGAGVIGYVFEAAVLMFLFSLSNTLEVYTMGRTRRALHALLKLRPTRALVRRDGQEIEVDGRGRAGRGAGDREAGRGDRGGRHRGRGRDAGRSEPPDRRVRPGGDAPGRSRVRGHAQPARRDRGAHHARRRRHHSRAHRRAGAGGAGAEIADRGDRAMGGPLLHDRGHARRRRDDRDPAVRAGARVPDFVLPRDDAAGGGFAVRARDRHARDDSLRDRQRRAARRAVQGRAIHRGAGAREARSRSTRPARSRAAASR